MIDLGRVIAAVVMVIVAAVLMLRHQRNVEAPPGPRDPHRGDWPPDQMSP